MTPDAVLRTAELAYKLGLIAIPPREDGTKMPETEEVTYNDLVDRLGTELADRIMNGEPHKRTWMHWRYDPPGKPQMRAWFKNGHRRHGVGLATGNRLECLEFDDWDTYEEFKKVARAGGLGDLISRIEAGYLEQSPGGGIHWLYYCDDVTGNVTLASRPDKGNPRKSDTLIQTRGEGGFIIIAPSHGPVHKTGNAYALISGGLDQIIEIAPDERQELHLLARAFDESPKKDYEPRRNTAPIEGDTPGNGYTQKTTWPELLEPHGWTFVFRRGETEYWRRPGKTHGISATINGNGVTPDRLYVFTSSTELAPDRSYTRFQFYTFTEHNGDFQAAANELKRQNYGAQDTGIRLLRSAFEDDGHETDGGEEEAPTAPRFKIFHSSEFITREPPRQLVRNVLVDQSHAALIGNSGTYKSFIALELALRVANGGLWFGHPVEQGGALYISGEGQASFGNRIAAWEIGRQEEHNIWILPEAIQLPDLRDVEDLLRAMDHFLTEQPRLIVIDTLARSAIGMDENSSQDMGLYIAGVERIMKEYNCTALTLHHANKQGMYRGSSALRAAWDTVLESKKGDDDHSIIVSCDKQKDLDPFKPIVLRPDSVTVREGRGLVPPVTSIVLQEESSGILTNSAKTVLEILTNNFPDGTMNQEWEQAAEHAGVKRRMFFNAKKQLANLGLISASAGVYRATKNNRTGDDYDN